MFRRRSKSMEIDDHYQESDLSNDENASQATTVSNPPRPERQKQRNYNNNGGSTTDDSLFKHPTTIPGTRARRSRSSTRKNKATYTDGSESDEDAQSSRSPSPRARRRGAKKTVHVHNPNDSLFNILKEETELHSIVNAWIDKYKQNREEAVTVLLEFFVNSSGNESRISPQMLQSMEMKEIVDKIIGDSDDNIRGCPLISTKTMWKEFQLNFVNFINILIHKCENSIIYDDYLLMTLKNFLTDVSHSEIRALRHTATVAALKILTALTEVISTLAENLHDAQHQLDSWKQKLRERIAAAADIIRISLESVVSQRWRDTFPNIRSMCIEEYKIWVDKLPKIFYTDDYLDAIGLSLFDTISDIRLKSLQILQSLYGSERLQQSFVNFHDKFKNRIVAMTLDKDINVSIECVKLLTIIHRNHREILDDNDHEHIYKLIYANNRSLGLVSGEFLRDMLTPVDEVRNVRTRDDQRSPNSSIIRDLVQFFIESELPDHCDYLVDAMIDNNEMMQDWKCMTDLLLQVPETEEEALTENREMALIKITVSCIKQASTGLPPLGRMKKALSEKDQKQVVAAKEKLTAHFMKSLIDLLRKYHNDSDLLGMLLTIPQYFDVKVCVKDPRNLRILLHEIEEIVDDTSDEKVLQNSSLALHYFCDESHSETSEFNAQRDRVIDSLYSRCKRSIDDYITLTTSGETTDQEALDKGIVSLKKITVFYANHNMNGFNLWNSFKAIHESAKDSLNDVPSEAIECSLQACYFSLIWKKQTLKSDDLGERGEAIVVSLKEHLDTFMNILRYFMDAGENVSDTICKKAYTITCDLLVFFSKSLRCEENKLLHEIVYEPDSEIGDMLNAYVQEHIFIDEDSRNEGFIFERRNLLMCFCRVIMYGVFPVKLAAHIFKNYVKHYNDYGDIIKMTLIRAREIDAINCALSMQFSLSKLFDEVFEEKEGKINDYDIKSIKELAKRFRLLFGFDTEKSREEIFILHVGGIEFIVTTDRDSNGIPINLLYFNVLVEFSSKLVVGDKKLILQLLNERLPILPSSCDDAWKPLMEYRQSLLDGRAEETENTRKTTSSRRSRNQSIGESEPEELDRSSDQDDNSEQMHQEKKNKGRKKTLKRTPLTTAKTRKAPKASTPGEANPFTASFHNIPQNVQRELEEMEINLTHQGKSNASQQSHMEVDSQ